MSFWKGENADYYEDFATTIPSDGPAYDLVHHLLAPDGKRILDFGCFHGRSSKNIMSSGAKSVLGVDNVPGHIEIARNTFSCEGLEFDHVPSDFPILTLDDFDAASMTFVHPTIENVDDLAYQINKIARVIRHKGRLVILGLNPASFGDHNFLFYGHKADTDLKDGTPFDNKLCLENGEVLEFTDYYWTITTLWKILFVAGFSNQTYIDVREGIHGEVGKVLGNSLSGTDYDWKDEWKAPLYQIIVGVKE